MSGEYETMLSDTLSDTPAPSLITFSKPWFRKKLFLSDAPYFLRKSREEGERELRALACSQCVREEGGWLFSYEDEMWYNLRKEANVIPYCEGEGREIWEYLGREVDFSSLGTTLSHYHIHPLRAQQHFLRNSFQRLSQDDMFNALSLDNQRMVRNIKVNYAQVQAALPSLGDMDIQRSSFKRYYESCNIDFRIVSPAGILTTVFNVSAANAGECLVAAYPTFYHALPSLLQSKLTLSSGARIAIDAAVGACNCALHPFVDIQMRYFDTEVSNEHNT